MAQGDPSAGEFVSPKMRGNIHGVGLLAAVVGEAPFPTCLALLAAAEDEPHRTPLISAVVVVATRAAA